jgi:hypothetical protein
MSGPLLIGLLFAAIIALYSDFVPYWDAENYAGCISDAVQKPFDLLNFRCFGHPSIVYLFVLGLAQRLSPWTVSLAYAANALLGAASIIAFHGLIRRLLPQRSSVEYGLVTALYAFMPVFVVHAIFLNIDYGVTAFFVLFLYFLVAGRFWLASVFGVATIFSKEVGAAGYAAAVGAYVVAFVLGAGLPRPEGLGRLRLAAPLVVAPLTLAAYLVDARMLTPGTSWLSAYLPLGIVSDRLDALLTVTPANPGIRSFLADIFILNYQWLYTAIVIAAALRELVRRTKGRPENPVAPGVALFLSLMLVALVYAVSRYRDFNNVRYVLIVSPVLIALFYRALLSVFRRQRHRQWFLGLTALLVFLSNFRTIDVVSKGVFGTFPFGSHALLDMPSIIGGPKLDCLVYNLESLEFGYLLRDMMRDVRPRPGAVFFIGKPTYFFPPKVDARSYALTRDPSHALPLSILDRAADASQDALRQHLGGAERFFYMAFPNVDNDLLQLLQKEYAVVREKRYERAGYAFDLYTFGSRSTS